jgi:dimeric dUTPase (all-alpha-NTP-PPase superfamily)
MTNKEIFLGMLSNQEKLNNTAYDTKWLEFGTSKKFDYSLAAIQELAEFNDSYGYSWWSKNFKQDLSNCKVELVDVLHFVLSQAMIVAAPSATYETLMVEVSASDMVAGYGQSTWYLISAKNTSPEASTLYLSKKLMHLLCSSTFDVQSMWSTFFALSSSIGMEVPELNARYMAKSALNAFRQQKGYRIGIVEYGNHADVAAGKYLKLWDGAKEDNAFVAEWLDSFDNSWPSTEEIRNFIEQTYQEKLAKMPKPKLSLVSVEENAGSEP